MGWEIFSGSILRSGIGWTRTNIFGFINFFHKCFNVLKCGVFSQVIQQKKKKMQNERHRAESARDNTVRKLVHCPEFFIHFSVWVYLSLPVVLPLSDTLSYSPLMSVCLSTYSYVLPR